MEKVTYYIVTYGCQTNISDSERIADRMERWGLKKADDKSAADFLVINVCSVRQSAVNRAYGQLANARKAKLKSKIIVTGCILDRDYHRFKEKAEFVIRAGDDASWKQIGSLPRNHFCSSRRKKNDKFSALIPIMTGCNNYCAYCVVPYTRGRELSKPFDEIIGKVRMYVEHGCKEFWFLGQNVNSYKDGDKCFSDLLHETDKITGDFWIRFMSSHPKDFTDELIGTIGNSAKITRYINLPAQSGDNEILKKMNRPYSISDYKRCVAKIKKNIPGVSLSTDAIVGFPGETRKQFENTLKLFREIKFDMAYISRYSPRAQTKAYAMEDSISMEEKSERWTALSEVIEKESFRKNNRFVGKVLKVLITEEKRGFLIGKTEGNKTVRLKAPRDLVGSFLEVKIKKALPWWMEGEI